MKRRSLDDMLEVGDVFRITDSSDEDYRNVFVVVDRTGKSFYELWELAHDAEGFGMYGHEIPSYDVFAKIPVSDMTKYDERSDELDIEFLANNVANIEQLAQHHLEYAWVRGDAQQPENLRLWFALPFQFADRQVSMYLTLHQDGRVGVEAQYGPRKSDKDRGDAVCSAKTQKLCGYLPSEWKFTSVNEAYESVREGMAELAEKDKLFLQHNGSA